MQKLHNNNFEMHPLFLLWFRGTFTKWMFKKTSGQKKKPKKLNEVASVGKEVTESVNKISRCCLHCRKTQGKVLRICKRGKCKLGTYCSKTYQKKDIQNHLKISENIVALETQEKEKTFRNFSVSSDTPLKPKQHLKLAKLVVHRPMINFWVNRKNFEGLWDTWSTISLISKEWFDINSFIP